MRFKTKIFALVATLLMSGVALADLNTGLVAYFPFNGNANDESGNNNNATVTGALLVNDKFGKINSAYGFDGNQAMLQVADNPNLSPSKITVAAWIKPDQSSEFSRIVDKYNFNSQEGYNLVYQLSTNTVFFQFWGTDGTRPTISTKLKFSKGAWHHVAATYDGKSLKIFYDGIQNNSLIVNTPIKHTNRYLSIGNGFDENQFWPFSGVIDEVRLYSRALTAAEITSIYNQGIPVNGTIKSMAAHTVTCQNVTTAQSVTIPASTATAYDCEAKGLKINPQDHITITIDGNAQ